MTNERRRQVPKKPDPKPKSEDGSLMPLVFGIGLGAAALVLSRGSGTVTPPVDQPYLTLSGESHCNGVHALVFLHWITNRPEATFDIEVDGHIVDTVYHADTDAARTWHAGYQQAGAEIPAGVHSYKVIGRTIALLSNVIQINTSVCTVPPNVTQAVNDAAVVFS